MKRVIALILILLLALTALCGCAGDTNDGGKEAEASGSAAPSNGAPAGDRPDGTPPPGGPGGNPPEGGPGGNPPEGGPGGNPPEGGPGGNPPEGGPGGNPPEGGPGGNPPGGPGGQETDTAAEPAVVTKGADTGLKDVNGEAICSGSAVITFGGAQKVINAAYLIDGTEAEINEGMYASASGNADEVVFLVVNGGRLTINGQSASVVITKTGSAASGGQVNDDYNFYGINSAVVTAGKGSCAIIKNAEVTTDSAGSNAIVATNGGSVEISDSTIVTKGSAGSRGLHATYAGSITADNVSIATSGNSSASIATDRGGGTVTAANMRLETNSAGSPLIYSTGSITVNDSTGSANKAQMVVVEGGSSAEISGCRFTCSGGGNRKGTSERGHETHTVDSCGIFIYQSFSGDASEGIDRFMATDCELTVTAPDAPMFFITNITAEIELSGNSFDPGCEYFAVAEETSEWGRLGSNGGNAVITLNGQELKGFKTFTGESSSSLEFRPEGSAEVSAETGGW